MDSLKFFDRDHVPRHKMRKLEKMIGNILPSDILKEGSKAVVSLNNWLKALVNYHKVMKSMEPVKKQLKEAEKKLTDV